MAQAGLYYTALRTLSVAGRSVIVGAARACETILFLTSRMVDGREEGGIHDETRRQARSRLAAPEGGTARTQSKARCPPIPHG